MGFLCQKWFVPIPIDPSWKPWHVTVNHVSRAWGWAWNSKSCSQRKLCPWALTLLARLWEFGFGLILRTINLQIGENNIKTYSCLNISYFDLEGFHRRQHNSLWDKVLSSHWGLVLGQAIEFSFLNGLKVGLWTGVNIVFYSQIHLSYLRLCHFTDNISLSKLLLWISISCL